MKMVPLTRGQFAAVDDADFERISAFKWRAAWDPKAQSFYAVRSLPRINGKRPTEYMARAVVAASAADTVDHRDHDTLNNTRPNLRATTHCNNLKNRQKRTVATSIYKGVHWHKAAKKWQAKIRSDNKEIYLGLYAEEVDAARAYDMASERLHGEYGLRNGVSA